MIGLIFYGAIGLWLLVAFYLGVKLPQWLKLKPAWAFLFVPLVIFAPVMDEVIAWPQIQRLCSEGAKLKFATNFNYSEFKGSEVTATYKTLNIKLFPGTVLVKKYSWQYVEQKNGRLIGTSFSYKPLHGFLHIPEGSSGNSMPLFLEACGKDSVNQLQRQLNELGLIVKN